MRSGHRSQPEQEPSPLREHTQTLAWASVLSPGEREPYRVVSPPPVVQGAVDRQGDVRVLMAKAARHGDRFETAPDQPRRGGVAEIVEDEVIG